MMTPSVQGLGNVVHAKLTAQAGKKKSLKLTAQAAKILPEIDFSFVDECLPSS